MINWFVHAKQWLPPNNFFIQSVFLFRLSVFFSHLKLFYMLVDSIFALHEIKGMLTKLCNVVKFFDWIYQNQNIWHTICIKKNQINISFLSKIYFLKNMEWIVCFQHWKLEFLIFIKMAFSWTEIYQVFLSRKFKLCAKMMLNHQFSIISMSFELYL